MLSWFKKIKNEKSQTWYCERLCTLDSELLAQFSCMLSIKMVHSCYLSMLHIGTSLVLLFPNYKHNICACKTIFGDFKHPTATLLTVCLLPSFNNCATMGINELLLTQVFSHFHPLVFFFHLGFVGICFCSAFSRKSCNISIRLRPRP